MGKTAILAVKIIGDALSGKAALDDTGAAADGLLGKLGKFGGGAMLVGGALVTAGVVATKALYDLGGVWDEVSDGLRVTTGQTGAQLEATFASVKAVASSVPAEIEDIGVVVGDVVQRMNLSGKTLETVSSQYLEAGRILGDTVDVDKTSAAFSAFKITGDAVVGGMDDLFRAAQSSGLGMNELADVVAKAGPGLTNLGFSFAESATLAGTLDKAGLDANATFAAMSKGMVKLARDGEEPAAAFQRVVGEIGNYVQAGNTAGAIDVAAQVFGTKGAAQFVTAIQSGVVGVEDLMGAANLTTDTILELGAETADAAEKWQVLKNKALVALEPVGSAVFGLAGDALGGLSDAFDRIDMTGFEAQLGGAGDALAGLGPVITAVGDLAVQLAPVFFAACDAIIGIVTPALTLLSGIITTVTAVIRGDWSAAWDGVKGIVKSAWDLIKGIVDGALNVLKSIIRALNLDSLFTTAWTAAKTAVQAGITGVVTYVRELPGRIVSGLAALPGQLRDVGMNMMLGLVGGVKGAAGRVVDAARGVVSDALNSAKRLLGINSPSTAWAAVGHWSVIGLRDKLNAGRAIVAKAGAALADAALPSTAPNIPLTITPRYRSGAGADGSIQIVINGDVLDAAELVRKLRAAFNRDARIRGVVDLAGTVLA